jgi:uncharacterized protein (TIGR01777 family)
MHILITGGTGFVGRKLVQTLQLGGHEVTVFSRYPETVASRVNPQCRGIGELAPQRLHKHLDAVINLAGEPIADKRWSDKRKALLLDSRIDLTRSLVSFLAQLQHRPKVLVSASAVGYYGNQQDNTVTEATAPHNEFTHQLCAAWEMEARKAEAHGIRVAIARIGLVVGQGGFLAKMLPAFRLGLGGKLGDGRHYMPWIHLDDLVRVFERLLVDATCTGVYNAVSPAPVTNEVFTKTLGRILHRPTWFSVPAFVLQAALGEMAQLLLTGQKVLPERLQQELHFTYNYPNLEQALSATLKRA